MKEKKVYKCSICGYTSLKWLGRCPECGEFNSFDEETKPSAPKGKYTRQPEAKINKLLDIKTEKSDRLVSSLNEFNRVIGGGIVRDSITIISSPPGGGKSTLTLKIADDIAKQGLKVLYASGEESDRQIKKRADRILKNISENIWIAADTCLDNVIESCRAIDPDLIIIDSIQTFYLNEFLPARAGNPTQTMECAGELAKLAKSGGKQRAVILIGQMNKSDELAGLRALEHLVDTVLLMDGENEEEFRSIIAKKNRFGSTGEIGFFKMTETGLVSIDNPSEYFVTKRKDGETVIGSAVTVIKEGTRPIISEIESLVSASYTPYPTRLCDAFKRDQMNTLISVLEQRAGLNMYNKNVVLKTTGGIKFKEQAANLAVVMSIASSVLEKPIPNDMAFIADVGLTGELKKVPSIESRVKELDRMGFKNVFVAKDSVKYKDFKNLNVREIKTINDALKEVFGYKR